MQRVAARAREVRIGDPFDLSTQMGAIISRAQLEKVERYVALGLQEGARLVAGGRRPAGSDFDARLLVRTDGCFADVKQHMRVAREEIFGPVLSILRWRDEDEMVHDRQRRRAGA